MKGCVAAALLFGEAEGREPGLSRRPLPPARGVRGGERGG